MNISITYTTKWNTYINNKYINIYFITKKWVSFPWIQNKILILQYELFWYFGFKSFSLIKFMKNTCRWDPDHSLRFFKRINSHIRVHFWEYTFACELSRDDRDKLHSVHNGEPKVLLFWITNARSLFIFSHNTTEIDEWVWNGVCIWRLLNQNWQFSREFIWKFRNYSCVNAKLFENYRNV